MTVSFLAKEEKYRKVHMFDDKHRPPVHQITTEQANNKRLQVWSDRP